jgi:hypothetical protein
MEYKARDAGPTRRALGCSWVAELSRTTWINAGEFIRRFCGGRMVIIEIFEPGWRPQLGPSQLGSTARDQYAPVALPHHCTAPTPTSHRHANAWSTAIVDAAFHRQSADHSVRHHRFGCTRGAQNHGRGTRSAVFPGRK